VSDKRIDNLPADDVAEEYEHASEIGIEHAYEPLPVRHVSPDGMPVYYTVVLTANQPVETLLGNDPDRVVAEIVAIDNPVVIAESQAKAQSPANLTANVPAPQGMLLPVNVRLTVIHTRECFVSATTTATASRVSVLVTKK